MDHYYAKSTIKNNNFQEKLDHKFSSNIHKINIMENFTLPTLVLFFLWPTKFIFI